MTENRDQSVSASVQENQQNALKQHAVSLKNNVEAELPIPAISHAYNFNMNNVNVSNQLHISYKFQHRSIMRPFIGLVLEFLLDMLVSAYLYTYQ